MKNESLDDLSLKPARDELVLRQQHRTGKPVSTPAMAGKPAVAPMVAVNTAPLWSLIVVLIVVVAGGGWFLWDKMQRLEENLNRSLAALTQSEQALIGLQQSLENRDKTLSKSGDQMAAEIKELNNEVRKLWDLANKRNRVAIEAQAKTLASLEASFTSLSATLEKQVAALNAGIKDAKEQSVAYKTGVAELQSALARQQAVLDKQKAEIDKQKADLAKLRTQLAGPSDLEDRITNMEVAIQSIDAYRRQVNVRLDQFDQQLGQLYRKSATP